MPTIQVDTGEVLQAIQAAERAARCGCYSLRSRDRILFGRLREDIERAQELPATDSPVSRCGSCGAGVTLMRCPECGEQM